MSICGCFIASLAHAGAPLPGPATGRTRLRFAVAEVRLTPATVRRGASLNVEVRLRPRDGFVWHEASLAPARARIRPPDGWTAEPSELALPPPDGETGRRDLTARIKAADEIAGDETLVVELRYAVRRKGAPGGEGGAGGEIYFEEADLAVELPMASAGSVPAEPVRPFDRGHPPGTSPRAEVGPGDAPPGVSRGGGTFDKLSAAALSKSKGGGSPVLPAFFLALAAGLVLAGVAVAVRRARSSWST